MEECSIKKEIIEKPTSICYEYTINNERDRSCILYIEKMRKYSNYFTKVLFKKFKDKGYDKDKTLFAFLDDFHPNGRGSEALERSRIGFGSKILNEILKDCKEKNVKIIFAVASTESAKKFFVNKQGWIEVYPKRSGVCYKEM